MGSCVASSLLGEIGVRSRCALASAADAAIASGAISDRLGRRSILYASTGFAGIGMVGIGFAPTLPYTALAGALIAVGVRAFQAVNWALLNDNVPRGVEATALGIANVATAGAGALAELFGPLVDVLDASLSAGTYRTRSRLPCSLCWRQLRR